MSARFILAACALLTGFSLPAQAQNLPYLDDRSDPAALVASYYNAINRKEYGRAWGYFGDAKPSKSFDAFAEGFAGTGWVSLRTGAASSEGVAGSVFHHLPVAIQATGLDGRDQTFAGCFTLRLANPAIQSEDFRPMYIEKASLRLADAFYEDAAPERCGPEGLDQEDLVLERAKKAFRTSYGQECSGRMPGETTTAEPESHIIRYRNEGSDDQREVRLIRFFCGAGAYNEDHVYYLHDAVFGLREQHFARPDIDVIYEEPGNYEKVEEIRIIGYESRNRLVNSFYDEASLTVTSHGKWRGIGDASETGIWLFRDGVFSLVKYEVDASYDGEINPQVLIDMYTAP